MCASKKSTETPRQPAASALVSVSRRGAFAWASRAAASAWAVSGCSVSAGYLLAHRPSRGPGACARIAYSGRGATPGGVWGAGAAPRRGCTLHHTPKSAFPPPLLTLDRALLIGESLQRVTDRPVLGVAIHSSGKVGKRLLVVGEQVGKLVG